MQPDWRLIRAREIIDMEVAGLQAVRENLGPSFANLLDQCLEVFGRGGKIVVCGVGKSGHIGAKIAATLASTGSPATFLHPVEALHGDLGVLTENDLLLAISYSGESEEILALLPAAKRLGVTVAGLTGATQSSLAQWCETVVSTAVPREACPFNLAPTTSSTALAAIGDALALVLLQAKGFSEKDYALLHPSGAIGRTMTMRVENVMRTGDQCARIGPDNTVRDTLLLMTGKRSGCVAVVDHEDKLLGIFTDGDFRRHITEDPMLLERPVGEVMTANPVTVQAKTMAVELLRILEKNKIDDIAVIDQNQKFAGMVDIQDLPKCKII